MAIPKYICRCGSRVDELTSYFYNGIRVTVCDECAEQHGFKNNKQIEYVDYNKIENASKEENYYHKIDTREKQ